MIYKYISDKDKVVYISVAIFDFKFYVKWVSINNVIYRKRLTNSRKEYFINIINTQNCNTI